MRVWRAWGVNACVTVPVYGSVTLHVPQLPPGPVALLMALAGSAVATWMNVHGGADRS
ncbi:MULTISPECIES: hypothetical protein [unclassified Streptomyces]|uniref:hypothetical protein n=1 Tax=unclassified Streptomyces TaxID=2593676 RepID=UPI002E2C1D7C|nr:hypothetical protein [Streptomyces sp. NBC_00223]